MIQSMHRSVLLDRDVELHEPPVGALHKRARVIDVQYNDRDRTWQLLVVNLQQGAIEVWPVTMARLMPVDSERPLRPL